MKKHLFYSILGVFVATSLVTLVGVTGLVAIEEKYLDKLIWAFLVQLAAAVFSLFRKADFFSEDEKQRLESVEVAVAQSAPATKAILPVSPSQNGSEPLDIDAISYFEKLRRLSDRPLERDSWLREVNEKLVTWIGLFVEVRLQVTPDGAQLQLHTPSSPHATFFVFVPIQFKDIAYSLRKGDKVRVIGEINCSIMSHSPLISTSKIERIE